MPGQPSAARPGPAARPAARPAPGAWWSPLYAPARPRGRVLLFPHSGGGPHALLPLAAALGEEAEVLGLTLPGRDHRFAEPPASRVAGVLGSVEREVLPLPPLPTAFFGCSLGALLAVHVAARFPGLPAGLVLAAQSPGSRRRWVDEAETEEELLRVFDLAGGLPPAVLGDPETRAGLLARLRADLRLGAEAGRDFGRLRAACPLTVFGGRLDPLVPVDCLPGWAAQTGAECRVVPLEGGHFAFLAPENRPRVAAALLAALRAGD
ncbi:thioesterase II family protein [Streptomyces hoynatensis]|uniref:thioesterase II family protein n=1 Tax=Streptomyces hoynatensis TaxID=1141874 RepID=UPI00131A2ADF|nr:thioesterase domain-containing protein [Streptomyces hoynatensis]